MATKKPVATKQSNQTPEKPKSTRGTLGQQVARLTLDLKTADATIKSLRETGVLDANRAVKAEGALQELHKRHAEVLSEKQAAMDSLQLAKRELETQLEINSQLHKSGEAKDATIGTLRKSGDDKSSVIKGLEAALRASKSTAEAQQASLMAQADKIPGWVKRMFGAQL